MTKNERERKRKSDDEAEWDESDWDTQRQW